MLRFDEVLELNKTSTDTAHEGMVVLDATGPLDQSEEQMVELCAWVFQRGQHDAAATEMTINEHHETAGGGHLHVVKGEDGQDRWQMPLRQVGDEALHAGEAFGVAVALMRMKKEGNQQRVLWWGHPVKLI